MKFRSVFSPRLFSQFFLGAAGVVLLTGCTKDRKHVVEISVPEQRMAVYREGEPIRTYPISTSKFGLGSQPGSYRTPVGKHEIARKIGSHAPAGAVFKHRRWTGEVIAPDSPGRDPIVSRILWLDGKEKRNRNAYDRYIYIHGTAEERNLGKPVSYGCIRMASLDVIELYRIVGRGAVVNILEEPLTHPLLQQPPPQSAALAAAVTIEPAAATADSPSASSDPGTQTKNHSRKPGAPVWRDVPVAANAP